MKTKLPEAITTIEEAKAFLRELHSNGELWHPEDSAHDMMPWHGMPEDEPRPTTEQCNQLDKLMQDIYDLPGNKDKYPDLLFDPCGYGLQINAIAVLNQYYKPDAMIAAILLTIVHMPDEAVTSLIHVSGIDLQTDEGVDEFIAKYNQLNLTQFIEAVEPAFGMKQENVSGGVANELLKQAAGSGISVYATKGSDEEQFLSNLADDRPTPFFTERIQAIGNEAEAWLLANVKDKIVLFDTSEAYDQDGLDGLPDCECWGTSGISQGWADIVAIEPYENNIRVHVVLKDNGMEEETALSMLDAYSAANLADYIIASRAAALED